MSRRASQMGRLKADVCALTQNRRTFPPIAEFRNWLGRQNAKYGLDLHIDTRDYFALLEGRAGRWPAVEVVAEYMAAHPDMVAALGRDVRNALDIADVVETGNAWRHGWMGIVRPLGEHFRQPDEAYCETDGDFMEAARLGMAFVGHHCYPNGMEMDDADALKYGALVMARSLDDYAAMLHRIARGGRTPCPFAVMFATLPSRRRAGEFDRVGMVNVIPASAQLYRRFRQGRVRKFDILPDDVEVPTNHFIVGHAADKFERESKRAKAITGAMMRTMTFAYGMQAKPIGVWFRNRPKILCFAGSPEGEQRMKDFGAVPVGTTMPACGPHAVYDIYEFEAPANHRGPNIVRWVQYIAMLVALQVVQATLAEETKRRLETGSAKW